VGVCVLSCFIFCYNENNLKEKNATNQNIFIHSIIMEGIQSTTIFKHGNTVNNVDNIQQAYDTTLQDYETAMNSVNGANSSYLSRVNSSSNPYLGKNVHFSTGEIAYVTQQGIVKKYTAGDASGKHGCPPISEVQPLSIPWLPAYNQPGTSIPVPPPPSALASSSAKPIPLKSGTPMIPGQSCGNEGKNVFVSTLLNNVKATLKGCFADNPVTRLMTFVGPSPPTPAGNLQNGDFSQPPLGGNSFQYISSSTMVPGWIFNASLMNQSTAWGYPIPYPAGQQAVCLQGGQQNISQMIYLLKGTYTVSFYSCGRPWNGPNGVNVCCGDNWDDVVYAYTPVSNSWRQYSASFTLADSKTYLFGFHARPTTQDRSTALQFVQLIATQVEEETPEPGTYSYEQCQEAAVNGGHQYFALQNVNPKRPKDTVPLATMNQLPPNWVQPLSPARNTEFGHPAPRDKATPLFSPPPAH